MFASVRACSLESLGSSASSRASERERTRPNAEPCHSRHGPRATRLRLQRLRPARRRGARSAPPDQTTVSVSASTSTHANPRGSAFRRTPVRACARPPPPRSHRQRTSTPRPTPLAECTTRPLPTAAAVLTTPLRQEPEARDLDGARSFMDDTSGSRSVGQVGERKPTRVDGKPEREGARLWRPDSEPLESGAEPGRE
jgi:hypothetical protein